MRILNKSGEFIVKFNGKDYTIPTGEAEINFAPLVRHIVNRKAIWGRDIEVISEEQPEVVKKPAVEAIKKEKSGSTKKASVGASMDTLPKKDVE